MDYFKAFTLVMNALDNRGKSRLRNVSKHENKLNVLHGHDNYITKFSIYVYQVLSSNVQMCICQSNLVKMNIC